MSTDVDTSTSVDSVDCWPGRKAQDGRCRPVENLSLVNVNQWKTSVENLSLVDVDHENLSNLSLVLVDVDHWAFHGRRQADVFITPLNVQ